MGEMAWAVVIASAIFGYAIYCAAAVVADAIREKNDGT